MLSILKVLCELEQQFSLKELSLLLLNVCDCIKRHLGFSYAGKICTTVTLSEHQKLYLNIYKLCKI